MVSASNVLIGGGSGFVGRHLVRRLREAGAKVRIISRKPGRPTDRLTWNDIKRDGLPNETTAVINLAGRNILDPVPWTESFKREVYDSRIETSKILVNAIQQNPANVSSFVTVTGVGYYALDDGSIEYDENWTQPEGSNLSYLMKLVRDWEKATELDEKLAPETRRVVLRAGVIIGRDGGMIKNSRLAFSLGAGATLGNGNQWLPWIHVDDMAEMFKFAIINNHMTGIINAVAPEQVKNKDFTRAFAKSLNRPAFLSIPAFMINTVLGRDRAELLTSGMRVKSRASLLGFRYKYPTIEEACNASV